MTASPVAPSDLHVWENSRLPVNRLPQEILIHIVIYVTAADPGGYEMLIRLTHVCTQWRQVIVACPTFWTHIRFGGGYMTDSLANLFFERAKQCALDVHISFLLSLRKWRKRRSLIPKVLAIPKLSPGQWIRSFSIDQGHPTWAKVQELVGGWADALSLAQELVLLVDEGNPPPSTPAVFVGKALKNLRLEGFAIPGLDYIKAPNLTVLELEDYSRAPLSVVALLDFFDATPSLEDVSICSSRVHEFPPLNRKVTLSHLQRVTLSVDHSPQVASYLICPSITNTWLSEVLPDDPSASAFFPELPWLSGQYSVEVINDVRMQVFDLDGSQSCCLQIRDPSGATLRASRQASQEPDPFPPFADEIWPFPILFNQVVSTLLSLPLDHVTAFSADLQEASEFAVDPDQIRGRLAEVFEKCLDLQEVVLENYSPGHFPDISGKKMPAIRALVIKHPGNVSWEELVENVTEAARARHSRGAPLERIEIFTKEEQPRIEELESLVREVEYRVLDR